MRTIFIIVYIFSFYIPFAQIPSPAPPQSKPIALIGEIHTGRGEVISDGLVAFHQGIITFIGEKTAFELEGYDVRDMSGKHIYPGFILADTYLGLSEIDAIKATRDYNEMGSFNPNVRTLIAYNADSKIIPTTRSNGILLAQITPRSGVLSGASSIVELDAWNWEEAAYKIDEGQHFHWPLRMLPPRWWLGETSMRKNKEYEAKIREIKYFFEQAKSYAEHKNIETKNQKFEAMKCVFEQSCNIYLHANNNIAMLEGIQFLKNYHLNHIVLVGNVEAWEVKDVLKEYEIPVILSSPHNLPSRAEQDIDLPYKLPYLLHKEGILVGISYSNPSNSRNLPFAAGNTVNYGFSKEEALQLITYNLAKIFHIEKQTGSLEKGKEANIIVSKGDVLDMKTHHILSAFIKGREIELTNHQKQLYKKFKNKYGIK